jgi:hypothetical protein
MKYVLALLLFASVASAEVTGFTIYKRDYVSPQYKSPGVLNPGTTPAYPATFGGLVCRPRNFSLYTPGPYENGRLEVWWDSAGTAEITDVSTICGTKENP